MQTTPWILTQKCTEVWPMVLLNPGAHSQHPISSDMSPQSFSWSQIQAWGIQRLFWQENWSAWQDWAGRDRTGQDGTGKDSYSMRSVHNSCNERCDGRLLVSAKCKLFITKLCYRALRGPKATEHVLPFDRSSVSYGLARGGAGVISHSCGICMSMWGWENIHHLQANAHWLILQG